MLITLVITIPLIILGYYNAVHQRELVEQKAKISLMRATITLEDRLQNLRSHIAITEAEESLSTDQRYRILNQSIQPLVTELSVWEPKLVLGYFSQKLQRPLAAVREQDLQIAALTEHAITIPSPGRLRDFDIWKGHLTHEGEEALILTHPVNWQEENIGYIWAAVKLEDIRRDFHLLLFETAGLVVLIWICSMVIIRSIYRSHSSAVKKLADHILRKEYEPAQFEKYPPFVPLLNKIKELRDHLRQETRMLQWMIDRLPGGFLAVDKIGKITIANVEAVRILKPLHHKNTLVGRPYEQLGGEGTDSERIPLLASLKTGTTYVRQKVIYENRVLEFDAGPIMDPHSGSIVGAAVYFNDITEEEHKSERILEMTRQYMNESEKLQQIIDTTPMGILAVDQDGIISSYNKTFIQRIPEEHSKQSWLGRPYKEMAEVMGFIYQESLIGRSLQGIRVESKLTSFDQRTYLGFASPIYNSTERTMVGAVAVAHDVTELIQLRKELSRMERLGLVGQMAASITHEIRNPMAVIRGFMQLMQHKAGEELQQYCSLVISEIDRSNAIINDFLALAQDRIVVKKRCSLNDIIAEVYPLLAADANLRGIELVLQLDAELPTLMFDDREIKQLLLNLIRNAMDAVDSSTEKGQVTVSTVREAGSVQLQITDTGCGISEDHLDKLFDPFYSTKKDGTGLGLVVCLSIVEQHGGKISVSSKKGVGSTFTVSFAEEQL